MPKPRKLAKIPPACILPSAQDLQPPQQLDVIMSARSVKIVDPYIKNVSRMKERADIMQEFCGGNRPIMSEERYDFVLRTLCSLYPAFMGGMSLSYALDEHGATFIALSVTTDGGLKHLLKGGAVKDQEKEENAVAWLQAKCSFCAAVVVEVGRQIMNVNVDVRVVDENKKQAKEAGEEAAVNEADDMDLAE
ncbi:hypothetical protein K490DRAFT_65265 [Saccharata proteae CBS 121410]|uniref:Uncharacterized protein n=1 Tax=Saccharata proteae CBS 121410 TaxID=1314787 RepID=A0A9P4HTY3_9PEZI|nr:hypothetical protein K490DRAFT_65265 [Saccharata proteae CBS 121410]